MSCIRAHLFLSKLSCLVLLQVALHASGLTNAAIPGSASEVPLYSAIMDSAITVLVLGQTFGNVKRCQHLAS
jgi:hypothetical protein